MADYPLEQLQGKTPLQTARIPTIDYMTQHGVLGMVKTVPEGMLPGSDTANLSVMGYDPQIYYSGRSPFEAASMGIELKDTDMTFRCNVVTLSEEEPYEEKTLLDHSADEISSPEAKELILEVDRILGTGEIHFFPGVSYRHLMVWENAPDDWKLTPPHDILGKKIGSFLPAGEKSGVVEGLMKRSAHILTCHEVNRKRVANGLSPANSIWIWGEGRKPRLSSFFEKYGIRGAVISAVDLIKGIGLCAGLDVIHVEGATGTIHTNFRGKAAAALKALREDRDFVYIHLEAPDECSHRFEIHNKVKAIEMIDEQVVRLIKDEMDRSGEEYKIMVLPDHATPLSLRTHTRDAVPFLIYHNKNERQNPEYHYDECSAGKSSLYLRDGFRLMDLFLGTAGQGGNDGKNIL
jgi:2,3-bisphosphoglycerate-independent phosphoglycerate mutase